MSLGLEIVIVLLLIVINGLFSLSELALVSARRARLAVLQRKGVPGADFARVDALPPTSFDVDYRAPTDGDVPALMEEIKHYNKEVKFPFESYS